MVKEKTLLLGSANDGCADNTGAPNSSSDISVLSCIVKNTFVLFSSGCPNNPLTLTAIYFSLGRFLSLGGISSFTCI